MVLDVRTSEDYASAGGHIPGAQNIPPADLHSRMAELEDWRGRPVAVVCRTNKMSGKAAEYLRGEVISQVFLVDDGMVGWSANGFKTK